MSLDGVSATIIAGALAVVAAVAFDFGHKYSGESGKFDEPDKAEELSKILREMRFALTIESLEAFRVFISTVEQDESLRSQPQLVRSLMFSKEHGSNLKDLIERVEESAANGKDASIVWHSCRSELGNLARFTYLVGGVMIVGFPVDFIEYTDTSLSLENLVLPWLALCIAAIVVLLLVERARKKARLNLAAYRKLQDEYIIEEAE